MLVQYVTDFHASLTQQQDFSSSLLYFPLWEPTEIYKFLALNFFFTLVKLSLSFEKKSNQWFLGGVLSANVGYHCSNSLKNVF